MAFCIECGSKAPDVAKFCPQCGAALVPIEAANEPPNETSNEAAAPPAEITPEVNTPDIVEAEPVGADADTAIDSHIDPETEQNAPEAELETEPEITPEITEEVAAIEATPSAAASLAAAASSVEEAPKSKAGLFIGLALLGLIAGGGAYALGLFGGGDEKSTTIAAAPEPVTPPALSGTEPVEIETTGADTVLGAYQAAIKSGRISDLGQFARDYPENSLAKDAETAAFTSLQRQSSVLAYNTFTEYFPDADLSAYTGERQDTSVGVDNGAVGVFDSSDNISIDPPLGVSSDIRSSITQRANELEPFIVQGDTDYVLSVIDEMAVIPDLTSAEATFLLNLSARAETSAGFIVPAEVTIFGVDPGIATAPTIEQPTESTAAIRPSIAQRAAELETFVAQGDVEYVLSVVDEMVLLSDISTAEATLLLDLSERAEAAAAAAPAPNATVAAPIEATAPPAPAVVFDTPAKPLERFGAVTPDEATAPGECDMAFSVSVSGSPTNIVASCTDPIFVETANETVGEWTYTPATLAGNPVQQNGIVVKIKFHLE